MDPYSRDSGNNHQTAMNEDLLYIPYMVKVKRNKTNRFEWIPGYCLLKYPLSLQQIKDMVKDTNPEYQTVAIMGHIMVPGDNYPGHIHDSLPFITTYT